jgi:hypothetical protein
VVPLTAAADSIAEAAWSLSWRAATVSSGKGSDAETRGRMDLRLINEIMKA